MPCILEYLGDWLDAAVTRLNMIIIKWTSSFCVFFFLGTKEVFL